MPKLVVAQSDEEGGHVVHADLVGRDAVVEWADVSADEVRQREVAVHPLVFGAVGEDASIARNQWCAVFGD